MFSTNYKVKWPKLWYKIAKIKENILKCINMFKKKTDRRKLCRFPNVYKCSETFKNILKTFPMFAGI